MRTELKQLLYDRILRELKPQSAIKFLKDIDLEVCLNIAISIVYLYTRMKRGVNKTVYLTEVITAIGHAIMTKHKMKKNSGTATRVGAFFLYSFEQLEIVQVTLGQGKKNHASYIVQLLNDDAIVALWETIPVEQIEKLPSETPYSPWMSFKHDSGQMMIKTGNREVAMQISPETHPILFANLNRSQNVGWEINREIYDIQTWALRNHTPAFRDIWEQRSLEAKATKLREAKAIGSVARRFLDKTFYHLYYYDFRGRKYPTTAYLHEQGTDVARGLLLRSDKAPIGESGLRWLLISIASTWAGNSGREDGLKTDKIPLQERVDWVNDNIEVIMSYAESPKVHQGWMEADKPWQFLAACMELKHAFECDNPHDYCSGLECYIDGSNNGSQHLAALVRDETAAPHVNLVPLDLPGDLYRYVAIVVWDIIKEQVDELSKAELEEAEHCIDTLIDLKRLIGQAEPKSERREELVDMIRLYKEDNSALITKCAPVFWARITNDKDRRKIMKRGVMTLPYGGTPFGLGEQIIDDSKKHGIEILLFMEHKWGAYMGRLLFTAAQQSLSKPMQLLSIFEKAGKLAETEGRFLSWTVPITNFPVIQNYTQGKVRKIWVQYGPQLGERMSTGHFQNTLQLNVSFIEDTEPSKGKQSQGASPNAIHSLDAAHLAMTVAKADFVVTTIHDSYGCLLSDMDKLFVLVRQTFVELYKTDPLQSLMKDVRGDTSEIVYGKLDIEQVLLSEYCFV